MEGPPCHPVVLIRDVHADLHKIDFMLTCERGGHGSRNGDGVQPGDGGARWDGRPSHRAVCPMNRLLHRHGGLAPLAVPYQVLDDATTSRINQHPLFSPRLALVHVRDGGRMSVDPTYEPINLTSQIWPYPLFIYNPSILDRDNVLLKVPHAQLESPPQCHLVSHLVLRAAAPCRVFRMHAS